MKSPKKLTFRPPEGFDLEQKEPGDTIEAVCELEIEEDGKLCLKKLNGMEVAYDEPKETPEEDAGFMSAVMEEPV